MYKAGRTSLSDLLVQETELLQLQIQERALAYVISRDHVQYCGGLELERQAQIIAHAVGGRGPNTDYLFNTVAIGC